MNTKISTASVVELRPKVTKQGSEQKWGKAVMKLGFSILPSLIFRGQNRLGLSPTQMVVLLHLADYWWYEGKLPFPSKAALAERMNLGPRQVQRYLTELEDGGFITRIERFAGHKGQKSNEYDLTGLVKKLQKLEPEFSEVKQQAKNVTKRGGLAARAKKKLNEDEDE